MAIDTLRDLLEHEIQTLSDAQRRLQNVRPTLVERVTDVALHEALERHVDETASQVERLARCAEVLGVDGHGPKSSAMDGLLREARELEEDARTETARDAALLLAVQKIEHWEIAAYGAAAAWAELLDLYEVARLLEDCVAEAKTADRRLNEVAKDHVNRKAAARA